MNVLNVPEELFSKYNGSGYALAAVSLDGKMLIDFTYCRDIDNLDEGLSGDEMIEAIADNPRFIALGKFYEVSGYSRMAFDMLSSYEFVEL